MSQQNSCFFFNDTATTEIYTLSLHDTLPISPSVGGAAAAPRARRAPARQAHRPRAPGADPHLAGVRRDRRRDRARRRRPALPRSEEHTSELQSRQYHVCRLLLEKKNQTTIHL